MLAYLQLYACTHDMTLLQHCSSLNRMERTARWKFIIVKSATRVPASSREGSSKNKILRYKIYINSGNNISICVREYMDRWKYTHVRWQKKVPATAAWYNLSDVYVVATAELWKLSSTVAGPHSCLVDADQLQSDSAAGHFKGCYLHCDPVPQVELEAPHLAYVN